MKKSISTKQTPANITAVMDILAETPAQLDHLSAGLTAERLRMPLGDGERSFIENLAHLINCEALSSQAIYLALMLDEPLLHDIHAERNWGKLLRHELFEFPDLLACFKFRRKILLRVLNELTEVQWSRVVREEGKQRKESVYWQARGLALHELDHLTDLQNKVPRIRE